MLPKIKNKTNSTPNKKRVPIPKVGLKEDGTPELALPDIKTGGLSLAEEMVKYLPTYKSQRDKRRN